MSFKKNVALCHTIFLQVCAAVNNIISIGFWAVIKLVFAETVPKGKTLGQVLAIFLSPPSNAPQVIQPSGFVFSLHEPEDL